MSNQFTFAVGDKGSTKARIYRAADPIGATLVLAPGAGAPQSHPFMVDMARRLTKRGIDVVTFDFLYATAGRKMPDRNETLEACWRAAIASVRARSGLSAKRFFIGGKSMGGRIAAQVAAADLGLELSGLVFLGYPLHPPGKPQLLRDVPVRVPFPMLFVQGARDAFGTEKEMVTFLREVPRARLHLVAGGDHSLTLLRAEGAEAQDKALEGAADAVTRFIQSEGSPRTRGTKRKR